MDRVVLARKDDTTWVGFQWTGAEPDGLDNTEAAEVLGAEWEGDELVTYDLAGLIHQFEHLPDQYHCDPD